MKRQTVQFIATIATLGFIAVSIIAILLWGKLRLVTSVPRTAFALEPTDPISSAENA